MFTFLSYIITVSLCLAVFYLFYKLLCSRDTWHSFNRGLLLFVLVLSAVIPFLHIDLDITTRETSVIIEELRAALMATPYEAENTTATESTPTLWQQIPWHAILMGIYLIGLTVYIIRFFNGLIAIALLIRRSKCRELADGTLLVTHTEAYSPFSWMRYIIVSENDLKENRDMILAHEQAHIHLHHSWDLLFVQLCATIQWFNPAAWLLKRELEAIHEYQADRTTLHRGFDIYQYQLRLFEAATGIRYSSFTNNFINCSTKKRIIMMMKKQTSPWALLKALYVLPIAFVAVTVISCTSPKEKKVENQEKTTTIHQEEPAGVKMFQVTEHAPTPKEEVEPVETNPEVYPEFPGGMQELMKHLQKEIKYPKEAQDQNIQGRVIVQFVVNKDGSICDAKVVKPVDTLLDAEALRVVSAMPKWIPGKHKGEPVRTRFTLPVSFRLK